MPVLQTMISHEGNLQLIATPLMGSECVSISMVKHSQFNALELFMWSQLLEITNILPKVLV